MRRLSLISILKKALQDASSDGNKARGSNKGLRALEYLYHFRCGHCEKWWTIGDAPKHRKHWHCPWCGTEQEFEDDE